MTTKEFFYNFRQKTHAEETLFSDAQLMALANLQRLDIDDAVIEVAPEKYNMKWSEDLLADQREYRISTNTQEIFSVQANLKQVGGSDNWVDLIPSTYGVEYQFGDSEDQIRLSFSNSYNSAKYTQDGNFLFLLTGQIVDVANGLKIYGNGRPLDIIDPTEDTRDLADYAPFPDFTPGIPKQMQKVWLNLTSRAYKMNNDKEAVLDEDEASVYELLEVAKKHIQSKKAILFDKSQLNVERAKSDNGFEY